MNQQIEILTPGQDIVPMDLVQRAIVQGASVEVIGQAMALHERWERNRERKAYAGAIADAKAEFGIIPKSQLVDFTNRAGQRTRYKHEDMSDISGAIDKPLSKHGLSYRWHTDSDIKAGTVKVTCVISHRDGHEVENSLTGTFDVSGGKNAVQSLGSTCTYLERYTLKAALGLVPDDDDDGIGSINEVPDPPPPPAGRQQPRRDNITSGPQPRQEPPPPPRPEPYSVEPPDDVKDNEQWHKWAGVYGRMVRGSQSVEEVDKWRDVNMDLLLRFEDLEPKLHKEMTDWITLRRTELLRKTPQL